MIISHRYRYIFFAVPKTGSQAVRQALSASLDVDDWQQHALYGNTTLPIPALAGIGHGHITAAEAAAYLPADIWQGYFKFAFAREPVDRFVSACSFLFRDDPDFARDPAGIARRALATPRFRARPLIRPQSAMLKAEGELAMDWIGRYETLEADFQRLSDRLGLPRTRLQRMNVTRHRPGNLVDGNLRAELAAFYAEDYALFGY